MNLARPNPIKFLFWNGLYWLVYFQAARFIFLMWHFEKFHILSSRDVSGIVFWGLKMDLAAMSWLSLVPFLVLLGSPNWRRRLILKIHGVLFIVTLTLIHICDLEIFRFWGCRMDSSALRYLKTPKEVYAAASISPLVFLSLFGIISIGFSLYAYFRIVDNKFIFIELPERPKNHLTQMFLTFILLVVVGRGGWQKTPINVSFACFSESDFANQAAINEGWNFFSRILDTEIWGKNPYQYLEPQTANYLTRKMFFEKRQERPSKWTKPGLPNIVLVIWESCTANAIGFGSELEAVTPALNHFAGEGIFFPNIYSTGDRTSKGLVGILSGYPAQPFSQIITSTVKTMKLPCLGKSFQKAGYSTSFYYGGEIEFDNMKSYLRHGGYSRLVGKDDFPGNLARSKWGVFDEAVFAKALDDLDHEYQPFFCTILTLTSHEPFEIPTEPKFPESDIQSEFKSALHYTDSVLFSFVESLKRRQWYAKTILIVIADHGVATLGDLPRYHPGKFHIPLLIFGGGLATSPTVISTVGSQQDLARTLLEECGLDVSDYVFSKNLISPPSQHFAEMFFNDGFTYVSDQGSFAYDNRTKMVLFQEGTVTNSDFQAGQAIMQTTFQDFLEK